MLRGRGQVGGDLLYAIMNLRFPQNAGNFLNGFGSVSCSGRTLLNAVILSYSTRSKLPGICSRGFEFQPVYALWLLFLCFVLQYVNSVLKKCHSFIKESYCMSDQRIRNPNIYRPRARLVCQYHC